MYEPRTWVATLLGLLAALAPWPDERATTAGISRLELLAPRGRLDAAPTSVHWISPVAASFAQVRATADSGVELFERTLALHPGPRRLDLAEPEQRAMSAARSGWIEVVELGAGFELLARGEPGRFALRAGAP